MGFLFLGKPILYFRRDLKGETVEHKGRRRLLWCRQSEDIPKQMPLDKPCPGAGVAARLFGVREGPVHQLQHPLAGDPGALGVHGDHPVGEQVEAISLFGPLGKPIPGEVQVD